MNLSELLSCAGWRMGSDEDAERKRVDGKGL